MPNNRNAETQVEKEHGHCADALMFDYGIPRHMRVEVCEELAKLWWQLTMIHDVIIASVRGWRPVPGTEDLKIFLSERQTHSPKNHKPCM